MPTPPPYDLPPPVLVQDEAAMARLAGELAACDELAIDTEADSFFRYQEKVSLVQITAGEGDYLVDPLAGFDLAPLGPVLADPSKVKVFHDGEYDVLILKRDFGFRFAGLFDTRVAAAALGHPNPGLAPVLREHFGVELDKSLQRSNWSQRPLSQAQIEYARLDTHFLIPLMHEQLPQLASRDRLVVVEGECRRLEAIEPLDRPFQPDEFLRMKGARALDLASMQVLRELYVLRDRHARQRDLPPFKVLGNDVLLELARRKPRTPDELQHVRGFSPRLARRVGDDVLRAIRGGVEKGPLGRIPQIPPKEGALLLDEEESELHDRLKRWRTERAAREGMDASLVVNRHVLQRVSRARPRAAAELAAVEGLLDWQLERFGDDLLEVVRRFEEDLRAGRIELRRRGGRRSRS